VGSRPLIFAATVGSKSPLFAGSSATVCRPLHLAVAACKQPCPNLQTRNVFGSHSVPTRTVLNPQSPPMSPGSWAVIVGSRPLIFSAIVGSYALVVIVERRDVAARNKPRQRRLGLFWHSSIEDLAIPPSPSAPVPHTPPVMGQTPGLWPYGTRPVSAVDVRRRWPWEAISREGLAGGTLR
jgi:hypothetical protein